MGLMRRVRQVGLCDTSWLPGSNLFISTSPKMVVYRNKNIIFQGFIRLLTEIAVETNPQVHLDNLNYQLAFVLCDGHCGGLSAVFMIPDGRPYTQCSALSIMSRSLIPKAVGTGCGVQMKVAFHQSDCCFNWSLEPLFQCCIQSLASFFQGVLILLPSAVRVGINVYYLLAQ